MQKRCLQQGKQHRDRHAEVSLSDNFVVIAFHALRHVRCANLAFSEHSKETQCKEDRNSTLLLYLTKLPRHSSVHIITKSEVDICMGHCHSLPRVQYHFHQCTWLTSPVLSEHLCCEIWLRSLLAEILPLVWTPAEWLQAFLPPSSCLLTSPILKVGSLQKLFLPKSTFGSASTILPLILRGLELVSIPPSSVFTNYCTEAKSSVLLSIARFPDTFLCQTGF